MSKINRTLDDVSGITIFCPEGGGFCDKLVDNIINNSILSNSEIKSLVFIKSEESPITNLLSKSISINSPANVTFEIEKIKIIKYRGINLEFSINDNFMENKEIKNIIVSINNLPSTQIPKRTMVGIIDSVGGLKFFAY